MKRRFPLVAKPEQMRPGHIPFEVPYIYLIKSYFKDGDPGYCCGFPYGQCLFIPRHGVAGATKVSVVVGNTEIYLPEKCVVMRNVCDQVMYPLPSTLSMNKAMKFRKPNVSEIVTLFWVRKTSPGKVTSCAGAAKAFRFLGKDHRLEVCAFDASTEEGACGGIYISSVDGQCVGVHGIGNSTPTVCPEFYPFSHIWVEEMEACKKASPVYLPMSDDKYFDLMNGVVNMKENFASLNY
jgi:hypothetical protein